jgi:phosphatidylglycerophosphatase C
LNTILNRTQAKKRFLRTTLGGMTEAQLDIAADRYATQRLPAILRADMLQRLHDHQRHGHLVVLVSASPALYLRPFAASVRMDAVLATELAFENGRFIGGLASPNCRGLEKVRRLEQYLDGIPGARICYAYGDSAGDAQMLRYAEVGWRRGRGPLPPLS